MFLGLCFALVFSACDRSDFEPSAHQTSADLELLADGSASVLRAMETTSPDWKEGSYDGVVAMKYKIATPAKFASNHYRFQVVSLDPMTSEIWIKYYSPQGNIVYEQMERKGSTFEADRKFQQDGNYSYAFFVRRGFGAYPRISSPGSSIQVEIPVAIPPLGNDYKTNLKILYSGGKSHDQWYFGLYHCTSWVALKVNQMWGTKTTFSNKMFGQVDKLGDAQNWMRILTKYGYVADQNPKPGDIIWFPPNVRENAVTYSKELGHVGFVHEVNNEITYSNYDGGVVTSYRVSTTNEAFVRRNGIYFIHIQRKK